MGGSRRPGLDWGGEAARQNELSSALLALVGELTKASYELPGGRPRSGCVRIGVTLGDRRSLFS